MALYSVAFWGGWRLAYIWDLPALARLVSALWIVALAMPVSHFLGDILKVFEQRVVAQTQTKLDDTALPWINRGVQVLVVGTAAMIGLHNLGIDITALIASLGIGGIAVALAVQNILADLFACLTISFDKPFVIGDFIIVGDLMGTVEHIGLKTTRIRSLSGEQLVFSNNDLLGSRIRNFKRMYERRVVFNFGVVYQTSYDHLAEIPAMVKKVIGAQEQTRFDRAHFKSYGDSSLDFEVVYYVLVPDYNTYMDIQQAINMSLFRQFEKKGIQFAYPTRTLYINQEPSQPAATPRARRAKPAPKVS